MGIQVEFNPDLALRDFSECEAGRRRKEECIPERLEPGKIYEFLKLGQRLYWLDGELPLVETKGEGKLSRPMASVIVLEVTHFKQGGKTWTKGKYKVIEAFDHADATPHFDGWNRI